MKRRSEARAALTGALAILGLGALFCLAVSFLWTPEAMAAGVPLQMLGVEARACLGCSLCGMSRAFSAASRLQIEAAVDFNRGVVLAYPTAAMAAIAGPVALAREVWARKHA